MNKKLIQPKLNNIKIMIKLFDRCSAMARLALLLCFVGLLPLLATAVPQNKTVKGVVKDTKNETIPGVSVIVKGTAIGATTDSNGAYSINVPNDQAVLQFTFIGFVTEEQLVGDRMVINMTLREDTELLDEVIVVGYGVQRKSDVTGSIAVVRAEKLQETPTFDALQAMKGRAAGVNIFSNTGNPMGVGDAGPRVLIRGANSINTSTDPLYVVDGVQMNEIQFLNPNDIDRMEVLKDASATAIYGARGANGVILITTKRGTGAGEGTVVSYAGWMNVSTLAKKIDVMNAEEFMRMQDIAFANIPKYPGGLAWLKNNGLTELRVDRSDSRFFDSNGKPLYDTDWQDAVTRTAFSHSHQLNIQSQMGKSSVGAFINYTDQQGIMLNNYSKRVSIKMAYDTKLKKWVSLTSNFLVNHVWGNGVDDDGGGQVARRTMLEMPPIIPVKMPDGSWTDSQTLNSNMAFESMPNPVREMQEVRRNRYRTKLFGNLGFTFHLMDGLDLRSQVGIDGNFRMNKNYSPIGMINMSETGRASIYNGQNLFWQQENFLIYNKVFDKIHRVSGTLGLSWTQYTEHSSNTGEVRGFSTDKYGYDNLGAGTVPNPPSSGWSRWSMNSYFGRLAYTLMDRYMFTGTFRIDGSSRFGANNKYGVFPSMGLGWQMSNEEFMKEITWINTLKLHTSYGTTGNSEISPYTTLSTISSGTYLINGERAPYSVMSRMPNPDLRWEKTKQFDIGINLNLFDNRLILELDYYYKKTTDLLLSRPLPQTTGFSSVMDNIGRVDNQGIDMMLTVYPVRNKDLIWESVINLNYNKNEVKKLGANNEDITDLGMNWVEGQNILRVGEPMSSFYGYQRYGTYSTEEAAANSNIIAGTAKRSSDKRIIGNGMPTLTGSFINRFTYKNIELLLDLQFVANVDIWQLTFHSLEDRAGIANGLRTILYDGWTPTNQNTMVQQIRHAGAAGGKVGQDSRADSHWVSNGAYLRGNLIQVAYVFPSKIVDKMGLKGLRVNLGIQNAFVIHSKDFKGYDPEGSTSTNRFMQNMMFYQYPSARTYTMGLNFSF